MDQSIKKLLSKFNGNPPATKVAIRDLEAAAKIKLPEDYADFLMLMNGGEGWVGEAYVALDKVEELLGLNKQVQVNEWAPGLFLIGSNGAGEAYAFDTGNSTMSIVMVPLIGMELKTALPVAPSFTEFLGNPLPPSFRSE